MAMRLTSPGLRSVSAPHCVRRGQNDTIVKQTSSNEHAASKMLSVGGQRQERERVKNPQVSTWLTRRDGLADRLKRARGAITARQLATEAGWHDGSKVSKIESGRQLPTDDDLEKWARITGQPHAVLSEWRTMLSEAQAFRTDFVRRVRNGNVETVDEQQPLIEKSKVFRMFETAEIPRFLQLVDYTRAILQASRFGVDDGEDLDALAEKRRESEMVLYDTTRTFEFILTEPVLLWGVAPAAVMHSQLDRLLSVVGAPRIRLGIIPLRAPIRHLPEHSFEIYGDTAIVRSDLGEFRETDSRLKRLSDIMDYLWEDAVEGDAARKLVLAAQASLPKS